MIESQLLTKLVGDVIEREGHAYTVDPVPTKYGITQEEWTAFYGRFVGSNEIAAETEDHARSYYEREFASWPFWAVADAALREFLFDFAVNSGQVRAIQHLQRAVGVADDGIWGPVTQAAFDHADPKFVLKGLIHSRMHLMIATALSDVPNDVVQRTRLSDLEGWWNRVWDVGVSLL